MDEDKKTQDIDSQDDTSNNAVKAGISEDDSALDQSTAIPTPPPRVEEEAVAKESVQYSDRNHLVAVLLAAFTPFGLTRLYTGHKDGVFRIYWFLGLIVLFYVAGLLTISTGLGGVGVSLLFIVGGLMLVSLPVLYIWGFIDFVLSLSRDTDAKGLPLQASERDKKWAKTIFYTVIGLIVAYIIMVALSFASLSVVDINNSLPNSTPWTNI